MGQCNINVEIIKGLFLEDSDLSLMSFLIMYHIYCDLLLP